MSPPANPWPALAYADWADTCNTLHLWTQVVGKVKLALAPLQNHWWGVTLFVTARGLTTGAMPYRDRALQIDFDFCAHQLVLHTSDARAARVAVEAAESEIEGLVHDMQSPAWPRVSLVDALLDETYDPHLFKRSH